MAIRIQRSVTIARPLADVALYVMRLDHETDYWPGVKSVKLVSGTPGHVGATYERTFDAMGREQKATIMVAEHQPGRRLVVQSAPGLVTVRGMMTFAPAAIGTELALAMDVQTKWFLYFSQGRIRKNVEANAAEALANLKRLLEARRAPLVSGPFRVTAAPPAAAVLRTRGSSGNPRPRPLPGPTPSAPGTLPPRA